MGLDMYAYIGDINSDNRQEIAYWRKFNHLHGWMENLYRERGGTGEFNCVPVKLTNDDLDKLSYDIKHKNLIPREGFFFGEQKLYPEDIKRTKVFIKRARQALDEGKEVHYDSWW